MIDTLYLWRLDMDFIPIPIITWRKTLWFKSYHIFQRCITHGDSTIVYVLLEADDEEIKKKVKTRISREMVKNLTL